MLYHYGNLNTHIAYSPTPPACASVCTGYSMRDGTHQEGQTVLAMLCCSGNLIMKRALYLCAHLPTARHSLLAPLGGLPQLG